jgi:hypothetical protein
LTIGLDVRQRLINNKPGTLEDRKSDGKFEVHEIEEESTVPKVNASFTKAGG